MVAEIISFSLAKEWLVTLGKAFVSIRKRHQKEIERIGDVFGDPEALAPLYVPPFGQNVNPADYREDHSGMIAKQPIMESLFQFFSGPLSISEEQNKAVVLGDTGTGKTSLLIMLKLLQLNSFFPKGYECLLLKIGPKVLDEIAAIKGRNNKILLLDSLDEDRAVGRVPIEERIGEIFGAAKNFRRVVMTCRSQFFPKGKDDPFKWQGFIEVGNSRFMCLFLSPFTDAQVDEYLAKKFPYGWLPWLSKNEKREEAQKLMGLMRDLKFRPMLLSYIDLILGSTEKNWNEYSVYNAMRDQWIIREVKKEHIKLTMEELRSLSTCLALYMFDNDKSACKLSDIKKNIENWKLNRSCIADIDAMEVGGRSLLIKDSEGRFRFTHRSIMEFLVAEDLLVNPRPVKITDQIREFLLETLYDPKAENQNKAYEVVKINRIALKERAMDIGKGILIPFVLIPPGTYWMGSSEFEQGSYKDERPQHEVRIANPFYIGKYPVTQAQYERIMGENSSSFKGATRPVENVSWEQSREFCTKLSRKVGETLRLPSEAEWEYACRAGTTKSYCSGDSEGELSRVAWYSGNSGRHTHPVGEKEPNALGLYDMHGNVWEWVEDDWHDNYRGAPASGSAWVGEPRADLRVGRGGSWGNDPKICRSASRLRYNPGFRYADFGFRLLLDKK